jgi:dTDP-4-dehydrorhamnose 3,5-epimerase
MIDGVEIFPLRRIVDERGSVMHMLRADADHFQGFGEIYFATVNPGAIKGWHIHREITLNYTCVAGMVKLVMYDDRDGSPTAGVLQELFVGTENYVMVRIPAMVWNGVKGLGQSPAMIANCASHPHDPDEISRLDPFSDRIPYDWSLRHG